MLRSVEVLARVLESSQKKRKGGSREGLVSSERRSVGRTQADVASQVSHPSPVETCARAIRSCVAVFCCLRATGRSLVRAVAAWTSAPPPPPSPLNLVRTALYWELTRIQNWPCSSRWCGSAPSSSGWRWVRARRPSYEPAPAQAGDRPKRRDLENALLQLHLHRHSGHPERSSA